jgi:hypothetical protein
MVDATRVTRKKAARPAEVLIAISNSGQDIRPAFRGRLALPGKGTDGRVPHRKRRRRDGLSLRFVPACTSGCDTDDSKDPYRRRPHNLQASWRSVYSRRPARAWMLPRDQQTGAQMISGTFFMGRSRVSQPCCKAFQSAIQRSWSVE